MPRLEELTRGALVKGIRPDGPVTVLDVRWYGAGAVELTFKDTTGAPGNEILYRSDEARLEIVATGPAWTFAADGHLFKLASEAYRIRLAHLFDPLLAVHTSQVVPLPHQILAVYGEMLPRQPLRFLLADDPGAGKTIMAGLLIKELYIRGDLRRCMVICPGALAEQWQDELWEKFQLPFEILTNDKLESARTGNWLGENDLVICRLDKLSRDLDLQAKLAHTEWDLVIADEAHKMSASRFGDEVKETLRYKLGKLVGSLTRHLLLMTATPHNGKDEDFQLFLALLDPDRFEGKVRDGRRPDFSDLMRRLVKEQLLKFDGKPLFPERRAYSPTYELSEAEGQLYADVTRYVRDEFNRADKLDEKRRGTVGFALTILQRRLASSSEAICQSLRRRRERLERRLEAERGDRSPEPGAALRLGAAIELSPDELDELDDAPEAEAEAVEEQILDQATAARTLAELAAEIATLQGLERQALKVRHGGTDRKWDELRSLLAQDEMFGPDGRRRKLVIFTEHRDTLNYLATQIAKLLGRAEAVVTIHGGLGRDDRREAQELFVNNPSVEVLVATDAAGEGINLQRSHLMVNYDLPWNPNRIEQRFGRIHRIGQTEVCHLWNLIAQGTREGDVFKRLFEKLEEQRQALGSGVFDILGQLFRDRPLRELLVDAIRYGDRPEVRARLEEAVDNLADRERCRSLLEERALARDAMDTQRVFAIREELERAQARRLQPHFIAEFFLEAFRQLGGTASRREPDRWEIRHVPAALRSRDRQTGRSAPVLDRYERITFEKERINVQGLPLAAFISPGHPLLDATIDLILARHRPLFKEGAVLVDPTDMGTEPRVLVYLDHAIADAGRDEAGRPRTVSREVHYVEIGRGGAHRLAGHAPYLDYEPLVQEDRPLVTPLLREDWLNEDLESQAVAYAIAELVPRHLEQVRSRRLEAVAKTEAAVKDRLLREINYWDGRAEELKAQELAGKTPRLNSGKARQRADELQARLDRRLAELERERHLSALPPVVVGGALIVPRGFLSFLRSEVHEGADAADRELVERLALEAVIAAEQALGHDPRDVSREKLGYDIESRVPHTGRLRFLEVKGRHAGATTVTVTKNEILTGLNKPEDFILAVVVVADGTAREVHYLRQPFTREPDFSATSVNYDLWDLLGRAEAPA
jgi:superfamily II DNA or RNA helicase